MDIVAKARGLETRLPTPIPAPAPRRWRGALRVAAASLAASLLLAAGLVWRLSWSDGRAWSVTRGDLPHSSELVPGAVLHTDTGEWASIAVARIGRIALSPGSRLRMLATRAGHHRVQLEQGHLRARIWAPPGWFGIASGGAELIDLGCDFDLWQQTDGSGRVQVRSGWIAYRIARQELLVPAGYALRFDHERAYTPLRPAAQPAFAKAVRDLDRRLHDAGGASAAALTASATVATLATDADGFTLLSLLTRYPALARGPLYARLAHSLGTDAHDSGHRAAWIVGNRRSIDLWWALLPVHPKSWWRNWTDWL